MELPPATPPSSGSSSSGESGTPPERSTYVTPPQDMPHARETESLDIPSANTTGTTNAADASREETSVWQGSESAPVTPPPAPPLRAYSPQPPPPLRYGEPRPAITPNRIGEPIRASEPGIEPRAEPPIQMPRHDSLRQLRQLLRRQRHRNQAHSRMHIRRLPGPHLSAPRSHPHLHQRPRKHRGKHRSHHHRQRSGQRHHSPHLPPPRSLHRSSHHHSSSPQQERQIPPTIRIHRSRPWRLPPPHRRNHGPTAHLPMHRHRARHLPAPRLPPRTQAGIPRQIRSLPPHLPCALRVQTMGCLPLSRYCWRSSRCFRSSTRSVPRTSMGRNPCRCRRSHSHKVRAIR